MRSRMKRLGSVGLTWAMFCGIALPAERASARSMVNTANNPAARAALAKALAAGSLDQVRVAWTVWSTRDVSQTVEIKKGRLSRYGGMVKNARNERALTDDEKKQLLEALRGARADKLVWIDRDVKNDNDRVLNLDVFKADGSVDPVGAFVRTGSMWRNGATAPLAELLEKWLSSSDGK